ncbi:hypothetical protein FDP41_006029 [Naegleria fowleri]|uniref:BTB domain-containing protein n=1 Tax=Naegleria fowleri TaxID=5763 RepID=A0A6A5BLI9_NAEFO|nr:uncharacterized protein FDP41_006029 [Naegleria fowleri]KAF0974924.1 hypothetical protein FDP41_006029 [Naegleria fowleri]
MKRGNSSPISSSDQRMKKNKQEDDEAAIALDQQAEEEVSEERDEEGEEDDLYMSHEDYWSSVADIGCSDHNDEDEEEDFSDVILRTSFHDYHLHKIVLNKCNYFKMCMKRTLGFNESKQDENGKQMIDLKHAEETLGNSGIKFDKQMFDKVVQFIYCNYVEVEDADVNDLYYLIQIGDFLDMKQLQNYILQNTLPHFKIYLKERLGIEIPIQEIIFYSLSVVADGNDTETELSDIDKNEIFTHSLVQPYKNLMQQLKDMIQHSEVSSIRESSAQSLAQKLCPELTPYPSATGNNVDILLTRSEYVEFSLESCVEMECFCLLFGGLFNLRIDCDERSSAYWWTFTLENLECTYPVKVSLYLMSRNSCGGVEWSCEVFQSSTPLEQGKSQELGVVYGEQLYIGNVDVKGVLMVEKCTNITNNTHVFEQKRGQDPVL